MKRFLLLASLFSAMFSSSSAQPVEVGAPAPTAKARTDTGATLDLAEVYQKNRYTLVYFYPKADTPGCTAQGCSLRDAYAALTERGVAVIGVSTDDVAAQREFKEKHNLPFTLLADTERTVMKAFGQDPKRNFASRQAYLIHDGRVVYADHRGTTGQQADEILGFLSGSQTR
jgi:thioredoxin-dependent peroxiredoxin